MIVTERSDSERVQPPGLTPQSGTTTFSGRLRLPLQAGGSGWGVRPPSVPRAVSSGTGLALTPAPLPLTPTRAPMLEPS